MPEVKIVILTGVLDPAAADECLSAGADAYLMKPLLPAQCLATLKFALFDATRSTRTGGGVHAAARTCPAHPLLTSRENEIMVLLEDGFIYKEIAERLRISYSTVHEHLHKIYLKFGAGNRTEAINKWRKGIGR